MRERSGWRRAVRATWMATCGLGVLAVAAIVALHSAPVRSYLLGRITEGVNEGIAGAVEATELEIHLPGFSVRGLALRAPGGRVVATAERLDGVPLWPLLHRRIVLDGAQLRGLSISTRVGPEGVDLFAAARRREQRAGGSGGGLQVDSLSVSGGGTIVVLQERAAGLPARFEAALSSGWIGKDAPDAPTRFLLSGPRLDPVAAAYEASVTLHRPEEGRHVEVTLRSEAITTSLVVRREPATSAGRAGEARVDGASASGRRVEIQALDVSPPAGRALSTAWPLRDRLRARGTVAVDGARAWADVAGDVGTGRVALQARTEPGRRRLAVHVTGVAASALRLPGGERPVNIDASLAEADDSIRADAALEATGGLPSITIAGEARRLEGGAGVVLDRLAGRVGEAPWKLSAPATVRWGDGRVDVGTFTVVSGRLSLTGRAAVSRDRVEATLAVRGARAEALAALAGAESPRLQGPFAARLRASGAPRAPELSVELSAPRLVVSTGLRGDRRLPPLAVHLRATSGAAGSPRITLEAKARGVEVTAHADLSGSARDVLERARRGGVAALAFNGALSATADLSSLAPASRDRQLSGFATLRARAGGRLGSPWLDGEVRVERLRAHLAPPVRGTLRASWRAGAATLEGALMADDGGTLELAARLDGLGGPRPRVRATASAARFDPAPAASLVPGVESATGRLDGTALLQGTLDDLDASWSVSWVDGRLRSRGYGSYGPFRLEARGRGGDATIAVDGASGGGTFTLRARARPGAQGSTISGALETARLPLVVESEMRARVTTRIALSGSVTDGILDLGARVEEGAVELPDTSAGSPQALQRPEGVVVVGPGGPDGEREPAREDQAAFAERESAQLAAAAPGEAPVDRALPAWRLVVRTERPVLIRRHDVRLRVVTAPSLRFEYAGRLLAYGTLHASSGDVSVSGAQVDAVSGTELRFSGPPEPPFVEIADGRELGRSGMEVHGRRPGGGARRTGRDVQLYSLLSKGRVDPPRTSVHSSVEGRGWGSVLERALASQLPIGTFLERGASSRSSDIRSSVTGQVDLGSVSRLAGDPSQAENRRTIRLGVRVAPRLRLEGSSGDAGVGGVDLMWDLDTARRRESGAGPQARRVP